MNIKYGGTMCGEEEYEAIMESVRGSIESGNWQANEQADLMEKEAANFLGVKYGILTNSGSSAGLLALSALELPARSEVIIPAVTFPTIFNIILQCDLVPVVVDCEVGSYNLDVTQIEKAITKNTRAIIAVHALGNPVDIKPLMEIAKQNNLYVIEDNCDGWGSSLGGKKIGSFGDVSITSFHAAHIVSTGVGGGVFTNDKELASRVRMYRDWGRQANVKGKNKHKGLPKDYNPRFIYEKIGYNFQILELQAAMGRIQLKKADEIKRLRKANFDYLYKHLSQFKALWMPHSPNGADVCWFAFPITTTGDRGRLVAHLENKGIETRSMFSGNITKHPAYRDSYYLKMKLDKANYIMEHSFWISCHPRMTQEEREYIVNVFKEYYK